MSQFSCQIAIVGEQQNAGCVSIQSSDRVDTLRAGVSNDVNDGVTFLRIICSRDRILRFVEQNIDFSFAANGLVMEAYIIGRQHFDTEVVNGDTIDGDDSGLNEIVGFTT